MFGLNSVGRKRQGGAKALPPRGLCSVEEFRWVLDRERARTDRTGAGFSLLVVRCSRGGAQEDRLLARVAGILAQRLRLPDVVGWLDEKGVGALLPATPAQGARKVAEDLNAMLPAGSPWLIHRVYYYPTDWLSRGPAAAEDEGQTGHQEKLVCPMETLFVEPLPLWKRALDVIGALGGLLLLWPIFAVAAVAVKLSSPGPVLFKQQRIGLGGRPFTMYKFRSMVVGAECRKKAFLAANEQDGPVFKIKNDPRLTPVGRFLRSTSIDELPQLWNVLRGDMSLVGPRPPLCEEVVQYDVWHRRRLEVTPGLTCIWQVNGRSEIRFEDWVRMDMEYIRSRSLIHDLKLLIKTVPAVLSRRGAN